MVTYSKLRKGNLYPMGLRKNNVRSKCLFVVQGCGAKGMVETRIISSHRSTTPDVADGP